MAGRLTIGAVLAHKEGNVVVKKWRGSKVTNCQVCERELAGKSFIDGATRMGPWAIMCETCHKVYGLGLGTGRGQLYNADGIKVGG